MELYDYMRWVRGILGECGVVLVLVLVPDYRAVHAIKRSAGSPNKHNTLPHPIESTGGHGGRASFRHGQSTSHYFIFVFNLEEKINFTSAWVSYTLLVYYFFFRPGVAALISGHGRVGHFPRALCTVAPWFMAPDTNWPLRHFRYVTWQMEMIIKVVHAMEMTTSTGLMDSIFWGNGGFNDSPLGLGLFCLCNRFMVVSE